MACKTPLRDSNAGYTLGNVREVIPSLEGSEGPERIESGMKAAVQLCLSLLLLSLPCQLVGRRIGAALADCVCLDMCLSMQKCVSVPVVCSSFSAVARNQLCPAFL